MLFGRGGEEEEGRLMFGERLRRAREERGGRRVAAEGERNRCAGRLSPFPSQRSRTSVHHHHQQTHQHLPSCSCCSCISPKPDCFLVLRRARVRPSALILLSLSTSNPHHARAPLLGEQPTRRQSTKTTPRMSAVRIQQRALASPAARTCRNRPMAAAASVRAAAGAAQAAPTIATAAAKQQQPFTIYGGGRVGQALAEMGPGGDVSCGQCARVRA